jgi:hypothetical protein
VCNYVASYGRTLTMNRAGFESTLDSPPGSPVCPLDRIGSINALLRFALAVHTILLAHSCPLSFGLCIRQLALAGVRSRPFG